MHNYRIHCKVIANQYFKGKSVKVNLATGQATELPQQAAPSIESYSIECRSRITTRLDGGYIGFGLVAPCPLTPRPQVTCERDQLKN